MTSGQQDAQGFAFSAAARMDQLFAGQCFACSAHGIETVGLAAAALSRSFRPADLDNTFAFGIQ